MTKQEFLNRIAQEKPEIFPYEIETEYITDSPDVIGCAYSDGLWKVYKTTERTGHYIISELTDEDKAFDKLYVLVKSLERNIANMKK